jgi:hypothetical protein
MSTRTGVCACAPTRASGRGLAHRETRGIPAVEGAHVEVLARAHDLRDHGVAQRAVGSVGGDVDFFGGADPVQVSSVPRGHR